MDACALGESTEGLPPSLTEYKHIPVAEGKPKRRAGPNYLIRAAAKDLTKRLQRDDALEDPHVRSYVGSLRSFPHSWQPDCPREAAALRPCVEGDLQGFLWADAVHYGSAHKPNPWSSSSRPQRTRFVPRDEASEGRDLAHSDVALPSDRVRLTRRPTLEREEAFRDATTAKGKVRLRPLRPVSDDAQVAELYRTGLLYDDDKDLTEPLTLNSIRHEGPLYSIRSAKPRARKARGLGPDRLDLDLSFADLGEDDEIARYLSASSPTKGPIQHAAPSSPHASAPLRVIYELAGSGPSFDVDTSQPPDLVVDDLSDYDYFTDSDLDTPSQRELRDPADAAPSDAWVVLGHGS